MVRPCGEKGESDGKDLEKEEHSYSADGNVKLSSHRKLTWKFLKVEQPHDPALLHLSMSPKDPASTLQGHFNIHVYCYYYIVIHIHNGSLFIVKNAVMALVGKIDRTADHVK